MSFLEPPAPPAPPETTKIGGGAAYAPTPAHITRAEQIARVPAGGMPEIAALMTTAGAAAENYLGTRLLQADDFFVDLRLPVGLMDANDYRLPNHFAAATAATTCKFRQTRTGGAYTELPETAWLISDGGELIIKDNYSTEVANAAASRQIGGRSYWARKRLQIDGMTNIAYAEGHDADVSPSRLLFAEKTDASTGANGINFYTIFDEKPITPIEGGDLHEGPFFSKYEGAAVLSRSIQDDQFPTALIKTTHMIPGAPDIVSVRAVPLDGLLVGLNETSTLLFSAFDSMVHLMRDIPGGGKIGVKLELAFTLHGTEGARNVFMRKIQAGEAINAAEAPAPNKSIKIVFTNPAVSFIQWTKAGSPAAIAAAATLPPSAVERSWYGAPTGLELKIENYRGGLFTADAMPDDFITALALIAYGIDISRGSKMPPTYITPPAAAILQKYRRIPV